MNPATLAARLALAKAALQRAKIACGDYALSPDRNLAWLGLCPAVSEKLNEIAERREWHAVTNEREAA